MKMLFVAPLPPPITGHSIVSRVLLDALQERHEIDVVDLSKDSLTDGIDGFQRIGEIFTILASIARKKRTTQVIYITISESLAGNLKDLLIYLICFTKLSSTYIHLHGGTIKRKIWDKYPILSKINRFFIKRLAGVIISGPGHLNIFSNMVPDEKIFMVPNFAEDFIFGNHEDIDDKFQSGPINVLYMSNLIPMKGYLDLLNSILSLQNDIRSLFRIKFAGAFESEQHKQHFISLIENIPEVEYCGIVSGEKKQKLFHEAHVFCLPTKLFEGQPISILEAYAAGCVVVTTGQPGIYDVFNPLVNGFEIVPSSPESISSTLMEISRDMSRMKNIAHENLNLAFNKYRSSIYQNTLLSILEGRPRRTE